MALQDLTPHLRTRLRKVEWFVVLFLGGTFVLMLASLTWFIKKTGDARGWWVTEVPYYTYLPNASGIKAGSPVQMMGFKVGQVTKVDPVPLAELRNWNYYGANPVFVAFVVREPYPGYITSDSRLKLGGFPIEIAGGVVLELTVGSEKGLSTTIMTNGRVSVLSDKFTYDQLAGKAITNLQAYAHYTPLAKAEKGFFLQLDTGDTLMGQVQGILGMVHGAMPGLTNELHHTLTNVSQLTANLNAATAKPGGVGTLVLGSNVMGRLDRPGGIGELVVPTNLTPWLSRTGGLGELVIPEKLNRELTATLASVRATVPGAVSNLDSRTASLGLLLTNLTAGTARAGSLVTNLDETIAKVKTNTVPEVNTLLDTLNSFVTGMKRHWLFRSAFKEQKTNAVPATSSTNSSAVLAPPSRAKF
jgi:hypothetical protein